MQMLHHNAHMILANTVTHHRCAEFDGAQCKRHVYFDAVRISLTNQVVDAYVRRTGIQIGPLRRNIAAAIANPVMKNSSLAKRCPSCSPLAGNCGARWTAAGYDRDNNEHDRDHVADFCKFRIWDWQVRSVSAGRVAAAAAVPSHVPALAVALATRCGRPPGGHSKLTQR